MGIAAGSEAQDNWIAVSPCPLCAHIWRLLLIISIQYTHIWACPICAHILVPLVPIYGDC